MTTSTPKRYFTNYPSTGVTPHLDRVEVGPYDDPDNTGLTGWEVRPYWNGVDRPYTGGWILASYRTAQRLAKATAEGAVFGTDVQVRTDVEGNTYVQRSSRVMARHANADLRRLGY
jgi:hypothetical protein